MQPRKLLIAAILLVALSGAVWYARQHPQSSDSGKTPAASPTLVNVPEATVQSLELQKKDGAPVVIARQNGKWAITAPAAFRADQDALTSLLSSLAPATADSVVEDKQSDIAKYGLTQPSLTVTIREKNGKSDELFFGDDVPAGSLVYARRNGDPKVYAVSSSIKTSLDKSVSDLRDKRLLTFDSNQLTRIELASAKADFEFGKNGQNEWTLLKPQPYRADNFQVEELLRKLTDAKIDPATSPADTKKTEAAYAAGQPVATAKVSDSSGTQSLEVRKNKDDYYAHSSAVSGTFKVSADLGKELEKPIDDFRNKKIFDFGFNDPTKFDILEGSTDKAFVRSGTDWKMNGKTMDSGTVQSFIDKLRDLAAAKFVASGFTTPVAAITVVSNDGKRTEKAEFSKTADGFIARRGSEPALYQLDVKSVSDMLEASKAIKPAAPAKK